MGLLSSICKIGAKAFNYGRRALKVAPDFILGETAEVVGKGMRSAKGSIFTKAKAGAVALEKHVAKQSVKGNFFKRLFNGVVSLPSAFKKNIAQGIKVAGRLGKTKGWGIWKGVAKTVGKKMPLIGALITIAFEAPNLYRAFKDGGVGAGLKEVGGAALELGCMAGGAAIGSAICPGIGTAIGGIVGGIVGMLIRGKTYTEKQEEAQEQAEEGTQEQPVQNDRQEEGTSHVSDETPAATTVETPVEPQTPSQPSFVTPSVPDLTNPAFSTPGFSTNPFGSFGTYPMYGGGYPSIFGNMGMSPNPFGNFYNPQIDFQNQFRGSDNIFLNYPSNYKFVYQP